MVAHLVVEAGLIGGKGSRQRGAVRVGLTGQERKVLQLIAEGHSNKEMAAMLDLSANTIHAHRNSVMATLNLHKQADLVHYAIKAGIAKL
jgi:DNA-binding CsgD family transcriptional regulator